MRRNKMKRRNSGSSRPFWPHWCLTFVLLLDWLPSGTVSIQTPSAAPLKGLTMLVDKAQLWDANKRLEPFELPSSMGPSFSHDSDGSLVPSLTSQMAQFSPMERVLLSCRGTVQHVLSAYYNRPVEVKVLRCSEVDPNVISRHVVLTLGETEVCTAKSNVTLHDPQLARDIEMSQIGLGQLLERSGLTPEVQLIHVGKGNGKLWRLYKISNSKISCEIVEEFVDNVFDLDLDHGV